MTARIIQESFWPEAWWHDTERWRVRHHVSSVQRPVEDAAFDNVFWQAMALRNGGFRSSLNSFERSVFDLDVRARRTKPHYFTEHDRAVWVSEQLRGKVTGAFHVKAILSEIDYIIRGYGHMLAALVSKSKWDTIKEVSREFAEENKEREQIA